MPPSDVLVVERGADWTHWMTSRKHRQCPVISVIQERGEAPSNFAARVRHRLDSLLEKRVPIRQVTLLGRDDWEVPTLSTRFRILQEMHQGASPAEIGFELYIHRAEPACTIAPVDSHQTA